MGFRDLGWRAGALAALIAAIHPARALTFNFTTIAGDTLTQAEAAAFSAAGQAWSAVLTDNIVVNVAIGFRALGDGILGQTSPVFVAGNAFLITQRLAADATSAVDASAVASLSTVSPTGRIALTNAEAKALGFKQTGSDGTIEFSSSVLFSDNRTASGTIAPDTYDLIGIAEHEIGHLLGFDSSLDGGTGGSPTLLDEFRFSTEGVRSLQEGAAAYFSVDGGATSLAAFATGADDQASHWREGTGSVMDPEASPGQTMNVTGLDVAAMDALGWDAAIMRAAAAVPEPAAATVMLVGLGAVLFRRRRGSPSPRPRRPSRAERR